MTDTPCDQEIRIMIASGWTSVHIQRQMRKAANTEVSIDNIDAIRKSMLPEQMLSHTGLQEHFDGIDIETDALGECTRLLRLQSNRLKTALTLEEVPGAARVPYVDVAVRAYWRMLLQYIEMKQSIGDLPSQKSSTPSLLPIPIQIQELPTIRSLLVAKFDSATAHGAEPVDVADIVLEKSDGAYVRGSQSYS